MFQGEEGSAKAVGTASHPATVTGWKEKQWKTGTLSTILGGLQGRVSKDAAVETQATHRKIKAEMVAEQTGK